MLDSADVLFATLGRQVRPVQEVGILSSLPPQTKTKPLAKRSSSTPGASVVGLPQVRGQVPPRHERGVGGWRVTAAGGVEDAEYVQCVTQGCARTVRLDAGT
jgi:hypothetical protein